MIYELREITNACRAACRRLLNRFNTITLKIWRSTASNRPASGRRWSAINQELYYLLAWGSLADREGSGTPSLLIRMAGQAPETEKGRRHRRQRRQPVPVAYRLLVPVNDPSRCCEVQPGGPKRLSRAPKILR